MMQEKHILGYKRHRKFYHRTRAFILAALGAKCVRCGNEKNLEFDLKIPEGIDTHHKMGSSKRMSFYRQEYYRNNLQVLCGICNRKKRNSMQLTDLFEFPF